MEYRLLGSTGLRVAPLCLGTANFADPTPEDEPHRIVEAAVDAGINLIDTADSYAGGEAERFLGNALRANGRRDEVLWAASQPGITAPLIGPRTLAQLEHLLPVLDDRLDDHTRAACDDLVPPGTAVADFHNSANWMKMTVS